MTAQKFFVILSFIFLTIGLVLLFLNEGHTAPIALWTGVWCYITGKLF